MTTAHFEICPQCHKEPVYEDERLCLDCLAAEDAAYMHDRRASRHINPVEYTEISAADDPQRPDYLLCGHTVAASAVDARGHVFCQMCRAGMA